MNESYVENSKANLPPGNLSALRPLDTDVTAAANGANAASAASAASLV